MKKKKDPKPFGRENRTSGIQGWCKLVPLNTINKDFETVTFLIFFFFFFWAIFKTTSDQSLHLWLQQDYPNKDSSHQNFLSFSAIWASQGALVIRNLPASAGDRRCRLDPLVGKNLWRGNGNPLQYSCLQNPINLRSLMEYSPWGCTELDMTKHAFRNLVLFAERINAQDHIILLIN